MARSQRVTLCLHHPCYEKLISLWYHKLKLTSSFFNFFLYVAFCGGILIHSANDFWGNKPWGVVLSAYDNLKTEGEGFTSLLLLCSCALGWAEQSRWWRDSLQLVLFTPGQSNWTKAAGSAATSDLFSICKFVFFIAPLSKLVIRDLCYGVFFSDKK